MSQKQPIQPVIVIDKKLISLPEPEAIVKQCRSTARAAQSANPNPDPNAVPLNGVPLFDESRGGAPYAWVKYGPSITMNEALTQDHVWQVLNCNPDDAVQVACVYLAFQYGRSGFIVMEYIDGTTCDNSDAPQAAAAVQSLISICGPNAMPGPIGGGQIEHRFFSEWRSSFTYDSVALLQSHINGILVQEGSNMRANFGPEVAAYGLRFCPSDLNRGNFMKDGQGRIVVLDFGASSFLPVSFFDFALCQSHDDFTWRIAQLIEYPPSTQLDALLMAHYALVMYGTNNIGEYISLFSYPLSCLLFPLQRD
ncbi:hypothetical protein CONPUDRAFT_102206 [Coniophora puteana RWD-64-598 SS2]|uniref:Aminoglycoside phosphotransferase domain-containing protein n=1 Tax=Coniophora puteana (strain RWD-64-598) TaxID=741705 RepID=A0A5M3MW90_CONPW|nr:uncharacterized protein CONPUDRAFT_102206 [Coniophora puteana RWD-64-598 SS2]EIW83432.1 hypothetical protein CONPUDRAFT_102206 [Coniophora puteana RWD-64-598 SS2]